MSGLRKGWMYALLVMCLCLTACGKSATDAVGIKEVAKENNTAEKPVNTDEIKDTDYVATIRVTINPDTLLYVDGSDSVVKIEHLNEDSKAAYADAVILGKNVKQVCVDMLKTAHEKGYVKGDKDVIRFEVKTNPDLKITDKDIEEAKTHFETIIVDATTTASKDSKLTLIVDINNNDADNVYSVKSGTAELNGTYSTTEAANKAVEEIKNETIVNEKKDVEQPKITAAAQEQKKDVTITGDADRSKEQHDDDDDNDNDSSEPASKPVMGNDLDMTGYTLKWEDEFNGTSLDRNNWNVELHDPGWVNSELQAYVDSPDNIKVADGNLTIKPIKTGEGNTASYTSGRINTQGKQDYTYGVFEVKAKVPKGMGYLPAFWLMPTDENLYGQWPKCGEIDAMEVMGQTNKKVYGTIHYGEPHRESQGTYTLSSGNFTDEFHTFDVEWNPGSIKWYVDGHLYHEENDWYSSKAGQGTVSYPAPFDQPFYMILNLAIGGSWVGFPNATTTYDDQAFVIDYVKVYQKDSYDTNVTKPVKEVVLRNPDANGNYINNGDFAKSESFADTVNWMFKTALGGSANAKITNGKAVIKTLNQGTVDYSVQFMQAGLPFEKGATYKVSFDAYADADRIINTAIKAPDYGYSEYMPSAVTELTTTSKTYTRTFKMTSDSDANGRLEFNMGACDSTATVYIDNVKIEKIAEANPDEEEIKTVRADGNYIYNGSFQEGNGCLGYWDIEGTGVSVTGIADGRRAKIVVGEGQTVTLLQRKLAFETDGRYAFSLKGEADGNKAINVNIGGNSFDINLNTTYAAHDHKVSGSITNKNVSITFSQPGTYYIDDVRFEEDALLKNGSFNAGTSGFEVYVDSSANASYVVDSLNNDNALAFTIRNTGDQDWKIQLKQPVALENDKCYKLSFKAKTTLPGGRKIKAIIQRNGAADNDWTVYTGDNTVELTSEYQTFEKKFKMTSATDPAANFSACFGKIDGQITTQHDVVIDDIKLVEIDASEMPAPDVPDVPSTPYDENLLNNPEFANNAAGWGTNGAGNTITCNSSEVVYDLSKAADNVWDIELSQSGITLEKNEKYILTYDVESSIARSVTSKFQHDGNVDGNWGGALNEKTVSLEAGVKQTVKQFYTHTGDTDPYTLVAVDMGANGGMEQHTVKISNISLVKVHEFPSVDPEQAGGDVSPEIGENILPALTEWTKYIADFAGAAATNTIIENGIEFNVTNVGTADWNIQLKQSGVKLVAGQRYKLHYTIVSTATRKIMSGVQSADYAWYGGQDPDLTADTPYTVDAYFVMSKDDDNATVYISLGAISGTDTPTSTIKITDISLSREELE